MSNVELKIAQVNETIEGSPDELVFSSLYPVITIRERKELSVTSIDSGDGYGYNTYSHNFGYIPQLIGFVTTANFTAKPSSYINVPTGFFSDNISGGSDPPPGAFTEVLERFKCYTTSSTLTIGASCLAYDGADFGEYLAVSYTFDILILMEEALAS